MLGDSNAAAIEREVQRRLTDKMAAAGVPQGQLSLQVLFMLPPDFMRAYVRLWDTALEESVKGAGVDQSGKAKGRPGMRGRRKFAAGAATTGRRYRQHFIIRDEEAFRYKGSVDRKLLRLGSAIERELKAREGRGLPEAHCPSCTKEITPIVEQVGRIRYCPWCGYALPGAG